MDGRKVSLINREQMRLCDGWLECFQNQPRFHLYYIKAFSMFGKEIALHDSLVNTLEIFVCHMYGWKEKDVDSVGTVCTSRVVEKSPVMHYPLVMML